MKNLEGSVGGRRKLKEVMNFIDKVRRGDVVVEGESRSGAGGFSAALLGKGELSDTLTKCYGDDEMLTGTDP